MKRVTWIAVGVVVGTVGLVLGDELAPASRPAGSAKAADGRTSQAAPRGTGQRVGDDGREGNEPPVFRAKLPDGTTIELLGVSDDPAGEGGWWNADGSPVDEAPYAPVLSRSGSSAESDCFHFVVRTVSEDWPRVQVYAGVRPEIGVPGAAFNVRFAETGDRPPVQVIEAWVPKSHGDRTDLRVGLSIGKPAVVAVHRADRLKWEIGPPYRYEGGGVIFQKPREDGHNLVVTAADTDQEPYGRSFLVVVDRDGKEHNAAGNNLASISGFTSAIWRFKDLGIDEVDRIELRVQRYAYAVFKDVSLKRGQRTAVRVSMEDRPVAAQVGGAAAGKEALPATQSAASGGPIRVAGRVVDEQGRAVGDAVVESGVGRKRPSARSDGDGRFALRCDEMIEGWLKAGTRDGALQAFQTLPNKVVDGRLADVTLTLRPAREVVAVVTDDKELMVAGAHVVARMGGVAVGEGTTDAGGKAVLRVPADTPLVEVLAVKPDVGLDYVSFRMAAAQGPARLVLGGATKMMVRVLDEQRRPLAGVEVAPWMVHKRGRTNPVSLAFLEEFHGTTDERGIAEFRAIPADNTRPITFATRLRGYATGQKCVIDPTSGGKEVETILPRQLSLAGRVVDREGRPVGGAEVLVGGDGPGASRFQQEARTGDDGRFAVEVNPQMAYVIVATKDRLASKGAFVVVREQAPAGRIELVLGPATRVHGRAMMGGEPVNAAGEYVSITLRDDRFPDLLEDPLPGWNRGDPSPRPSIVRWAQIDKEGCFELYVGPGHYGIHAPGTSIGRAFEVSDQKELEIGVEVPDTRPERMLKGRVVLGDRPEVGVANASLTGTELTLRPGQGSIEGTSDERGRFAVVRGKGDIYVQATAKEGKLRGILMVRENEDGVTVPVGPTASARGRLVDSEGQAVGRRLVLYGVRVGTGHGPVTFCFGGQIKTDEDGRFATEGLVPGFEYELQVMIDAPGGRGRLVPTIGKVKPERAEQVDLGELKLPAS